MYQDCPKFHGSHDSKAKYCWLCGAKLQKIEELPCRNCGSENTAHPNKYCPDCGTKIEGGSAKKIEQVIVA